MSQLACAIRARFMFAPPLWSRQVAPFTGYENLFKLCRLADEYLPGERAALVRLNPAEAGERFRKLFAARYFPLGKSYYMDPLTGIVEHITLDFHGLTASQYEPAYNRLPQAQLLAEAVCICPFEARRAGREPVVAEFTKQLGPWSHKLLEETVVPGGYLLEAVETALEGSSYPDYLLWCRWVFGRTGNALLDEHGISLPWTRENVERLTRDIPLYPGLKKQMDNFNSWLGHDRNEKVAEVLRYIRAHAPQTLMEVFDGESKNAGPAA